MFGRHLFTFFFWLGTICFGFPSFFLALGLATMSILDSPGKSLAMILSSIPLASYNFNPTGKKLFSSSSSQSILFLANGLIASQLLTLPRF